MQHITNNCGVPRTGAERTPDWPWGCHDELTLCQLILSLLNQGFCLSGCLCVTVCLQVITSWFRLFQVDNTSVYISSRENSYDLIWSVVYLLICIPPKKDSANFYLEGLLVLSLPDSLRKIAQSPLLMTNLIIILVPALQNYCFHGLVCQ